jgi:Hg(II)-responsive transcriptional regulator
LTISQLAEAAGVELSTIRYYERRGLVRPDARRSSGYREYTNESVRRVRFIRHAQALGFTLEEIAGLLRLRIAPGMDCAAVRARASAKLANVKARLVELERIRDALAKLVAACPAQGPETRCTILDTLDSSTGENATLPARRMSRRKFGDKDMESLELRIDGMHCDGCAHTIEALLGREPGMKSVSVTQATGLVDGQDLSHAISLGQDAAAIGGGWAHKRLLRIEKNLMCGARRVPIDEITWRGLHVVFHRQSTCEAGATSLSMPVLAKLTRPRVHGAVPRERPGAGARSFQPVAIREQSL